MIQWLYRYIFRGIGIVFLAGMITALFLAISYRMQHAAPEPTPPAMSKGAGR